MDAITNNLSDNKRINGTKNIKNDREFKATA